MTDDQIETQLKDLIHVERKTTTEILKLINVAVSRDLPLKRGFGSTFDWLTKGLAIRHRPRGDGCRVPRF